MKHIPTRIIIAIVSYLGALALITMMEFGDRGYMFTPDSALAAAEEEGEDSYSLQSLHLLNRSIGYVRSHYVDPERIHPTPMLIGAMKAIEQTIPEVIVETVGDQDPPHTLRLRVGKKNQGFQLEKITNLYEMTWKIKDMIVFLDDNLPPTVNRADIEYTAVNGMLDTLDPHSILLNPETYEDMRVGTSGKFGGLGVVISSRNGELTVVSVLPGTPAAKAGMKSLDRVTQIETESTLNMGLDQAVNRLRGEVGKAVNIWVLRDEWEEPRPFRIVREEIKIEAVQHKDLGRGVGYIHIKSFQQNTLPGLKDAIADLDKTGALRAGLVLDLRNDPGGLLDQAVAVSDFFLEDGTIVTTVGGSAKIREEKKATRKGTRRKVPMIVLVNSGSASASEIVAGALKNNNRALIMGQRTFGKGTVQVLYEVQDPRNERAALKLTIAQYLTPGDKSIQSVGVTPDIYTYPVTLEKDIVDLYVSDEELGGERTLDNHFEAEKKPKGPSEPFELLRYYEAQEEAPEGEEDEEPPLVDPYGELEVDYEMQLSRDLLVSTGEKDRDAMLERAREFLEKEEEKQSEQIQARLQKLGVDWSPGKTPPSSNPNLEARFVLGTQSTSTALAGEDVEFKATVQNKGKEPIHRLRALSESPYGRFDKMEWVFGTIAPGKSKSWTVKMSLPRNAIPREAPIRLHYFSGEEKLSSLTTSSSFRIVPLKRPAFAFNYSIRDQRGNGDGLLQAGEDVDLLVKIKNVGEGDAFKTRAYVKNLSGDKVFLEKGRGNIESLAVNAKALMEYQFRIDKKIEAPFVELEVDIVDTVLREALTSPIRIPIHPTPTSSFEANLTHVSISEDMNVFSGASEGSPAIAQVQKGDICISSGTLDGWTRIQVEENISGWVATTGVKTHETKSEATPLEPQWAAVSPHIHFAETTLKNGITKSEKTTLEGEVVFPKTYQKRDCQVYIFVNDAKVYFKGFRQETENTEINAPFKLTIPLEEGANSIVVYARQGKHQLSRRFVNFFREEK